MNKTEYLTKRISGLRAVVAVLLAIIMAASVVLGVGFGVYGKNTDDWFKPKQDSNQEQQDPEQPGQPSEGEQVESTARVMLMSGATVAAEDGSVSKTLTATILPENAPNKAVDWVVEWVNDAPLKNEDISKYVTILPSADGALTATLTCHKSFRGSNANVIVTTRDGGFTARCFVTFEGIPSSMSVGESPYGTVSVEGLGFIRAIKKVYGTDGTTKFAISLDNVYHDVGESYYNQYNISNVTSVGKIMLDTKVEDRKGQRFLGTAEKTVELSSIQSKLIDVTCDGKNIIVTIKKDITSYYESIQANSSGATYSGHFKKTITTNGIAPHFKVTITNTYLNYSKDIAFWFSIGVTSASLDVTAITF